MKKLKVVITGGTGLLATNIVTQKKIEWDIIVLTRSNSHITPGVQIESSDLFDSIQTKKILEKFNPDILIHTAGLANVDECEKDYENAYRSNVLITKNIAKICDELKIKLVHISTDHFANELIPTSSENDIQLPVNIYAETKLLGDLAVGRHCPNALIIRTNFFGWGTDKRKSFSDFIIDNLRKNQEITLFEDVFYTPILIDELVESIESLVLKNASGIFNVVSNRKISKYEFGTATAKVFNLNSDLILRGSHKNKMLTRRPSNMALSNVKLVNELGKKFDFNFEESLKKLKSTELR